MGKPVVKNYIDPISGELVIGGDMEITGTLVVDQNATVTGLIAAPLPAAGTKLGGIKAAAKGEGDTVEVKIGEDEKLYVPAYPAVPVAGADLGGVKAAAADAGDTVECKIDETTQKLMVPTYPVVPVAANQADSTATEVAGLVVDFNALLAKLKAAGLMTDDEEE